MTRRAAKWGTLSVAILSAALLGPVASASASDASIKRVFKSWDAKLLIAEGHLESTLGEYKTKRDPAPVEGAISKSIEVLRGLKGGVARQSTVSSQVKRGKAKVVNGLGKLIVAYEHLKKAFAVKATSKQAAEQQIAKAKLALKRGAVEFLEGATLLKKH